MCNQNVDFNQRLICPTRVALSYTVYAMLQRLMGGQILLHDTVNQRRIGALNRWLVGLSGDSLPSPDKPHGHDDMNNLVSASDNDPFITGISAGSNPLHPLRWVGDVRKKDYPEEQSYH